MSNFLGKESPGVGIYNPLKGSITDKIVLNQVRQSRSFIRLFDAADDQSPTNSKAKMLQTSRSRE
jgi:hypothetical protein